MEPKFYAIQGTFSKQENAIFQVSTSVQDLGRDPYKGGTSKMKFHSFSVNPSLLPFM